MCRTSSAEQEHHRHDDAADGEDRAVRLEHLRAIGQEHHRPVARAEPEPPQGVGKAVGHPLLLHVGPLAALEGERDVFAEALDTLVTEDGPDSWPRSYRDLDDRIGAGGPVATRIQDLGPHRRRPHRRLRRLDHPDDPARVARCSWSRTRWRRGGSPRPWWPASRAPCCRSGPTSPARSSRSCKTSTPVEGARPSSAATAWRRSPTWPRAMEVDKNAGLAKDVMDNIKKMARPPGAATTGPALHRGAAVAPDPGIAGAAQRRHLLHAAPSDPEPGEVPGLPWQRPQRARGGPGGDLDGAGVGRGAPAPQPPDPDRPADDRGRGRRADRGHAPRGHPPHRPASRSPPAGSARATSRRGRRPAPATRSASSAPPSTT